MSSYSLNDDSMMMGGGGDDGDGMTITNASRHPVTRLCGDWGPGWHKYNLA